MVRYNRTERKHEKKTEQIQVGRREMASILARGGDMSILRQREDVEIASP